MNKFIIVALVASLACIVLAGSEDGDGVILNYSSSIDALGTYFYNYELSNDIRAQEKGQGGHYANGDFSYISPEGEHIDLSYVADENGFQPTGSHLPVAPETPEAILRALEWIRTHPPRDEDHH